MSMFIVSTVCGEPCPSYEIGYSPDIGFPETAGPLESAHVYINVDDPVQCSGKVYAWLLCPLLESDDELSGSLELVLAMYRFQQNGNLSIVKRSYYELNMSAEYFDGDCIHVPLERSKWFDVVEGDMLAACWYEEEEEEEESGDEESGDEESGDEESGDEEEENEPRIKLTVHRDGKNLAEFESIFAHSCSESHITLLRENNVDMIYNQTLLSTAFISKPVMLIFVLIFSNCNVLLRHR